MIGLSKRKECIIIEKKTDLIYDIPVIRKERLAFIDRMHSVETDVGKKFAKKPEQAQPVKLQLLDEVNGGKVFSYILYHTAVIGRKPEWCDIIIDYDRTVSSKHCKLYLQEDKVYVSDLGSVNQTYVNDRAVKEDTVVEDGDVLGIGRVNLIIHIVFS